jgi:hypothetical protein
MVGICDCCDGSDEPNCPNTCDVLLKDAQSKLKAKRQIWEMGLRAKKDLIKVGKLQKIARSSKIAQAIRHQSTLNAKCARLLNLKNAAFELQKTQKPPNHIRFVSLQSKFKTLKAKFELISSAYSSVLDEVAKLQSPADSIVQPNEQENPLNLQSESIVQPPNLPADSIDPPNEQAPPPPFVCQNDDGK